MSRSLRNALAAAILALTPVMAAAAPRVEVRGTAQQNPDSHIEITNVFAFTAISGNPFVNQYMRYPVECVFFVNNSPVTVTHVRFYFAYTSAGDKDSGRLLGQDYIDTRAMPRSSGSD